MAAPKFITSSTPACAGPAKLAWQTISRASPAKREAGERRRDFHEIYELFDEQTAREQAARCIQCPDPLCRQACPLANRIPEWLELQADRPLPAVAQAC